MLTALEKPAPRFLSEDIKLTGAEEPAASLLPSDVKSFAAPSVLKGVGMKLYSCLAEEAVSALPMARKERPKSTSDREVRVEQLKLLGALVDRLSTSDK